jgi:hypothetical protein
MPPISEIRSTPHGLVVVIEISERSCPVGRLPIVRPLLTSLPPKLISR